MTPLKLIIALSLVWLIFGGLLQIFNLSTEQEGDTFEIEDKKTGTFSFIWNMLTFNVVSFPNALRFILTTFFGLSIGLSAYVLIRSGS